MAYHRHLRSHNGRPVITIGITAGNLSRLRTKPGSRSWHRAPTHSGPIEFDVAHDCWTFRCVLRLAHHPLPHPERFAITLTDAHVTALLDEGLVELPLETAHVVCVFGRTPQLAGEAVRRVLGEP